MVWYGKMNVISHMMSLFVTYDFRCDITEFWLWYHIIVISYYDIIQDITYDMKLYHMIFIHDITCDIMVKLWYHSQTVISHNCDIICEGLGMYFLNRVTQLCDITCDIKVTQGSRCSAYRHGGTQPECHGAAPVRVGRGLGRSSLSHQARRAACGLIRAMPGPSRLRYQLETAGGPCVGQWKLFWKC